MPGTRESAGSEINTFPASSPVPRYLPVPQARLLVLAANESLLQAWAANSLGVPSLRGVGSFLGDSGNLNASKTQRTGSVMAQLEAL